MATTPEGKVKNEVKKILKAEGVYYFMPATGGYGRSGVPDFVCCVNGTFVGIECKAGTNAPTELQKREADAIKQAGGIAMVVNEGAVRGLQDFLQLIKEGQV
jgi:Holliday junction resolvase